MDEIFEILATVPQWQPAESGLLIKNRHRQIVVTKDFPVLALAKMKVWHSWQLKKSKSLGAVLELPAKQHCQFSPFGPIFEVNGLNWQHYLAGSSKTDPKILIFSIAIGANYTYETKNSEI